MKKDIHPTYYAKAKVKCACGNTFEIGSTQASLEIEVCSACHPFYTGQDKILDRVGRVQKFRDRLAKKEAPRQKKKPAVKKQQPKSHKPSKPRKKVV